MVESIDKLRNFSVCKKSWRRFPPVLRLAVNSELATIPLFSFFLDYVLHFLEWGNYFHWGREELIPTLKTFLQLQDKEGLAP